MVRNTDWQGVGNRSSHPDISPGDWIVVDGIDCVVSKIYSPDYQLGICEIVCNPRKPANRDVIWDQDKWAFFNPNDFGGYAERYPRLAPFVSKLKRGRWQV